MDTGSSDPVGPALQAAERVLETTLAEACATEPASKVSTGELIRIDELLETASDAAKRAISLRRRKRADDAARQAARAAMADIEAAASADATHRIYRDARGVRWDVFAVHPRGRLSSRRPLPESYSRGWLCFDAATEKRRLGPIPHHWDQLTNEDLERLAGHAEVIPSGPARSRSQPGTSDRPTPG